MSQSIESVINTLLSDSKSNEIINSLVKGMSNGKSEQNDEVAESVSNVKSDIIQKKIDIINALIPALSEKNAEHAKFIIKILKITKLIYELEAQ